MKYHRWRTPELNYLIATFPALGDAHYAERFQTTIGSVRARRETLRLKRQKYARPKGPFTRKAITPA